MKNFAKAPNNIETAIKAHKISDMVCLGLGNMEKAKQDVRFIKTLYYQERAFIVISEYINKPEHFDVEWFKSLVDTKTQRYA